MKDCEVCKARLSNTFAAREMMLGFRDEFEYGICSNCGTIQILSEPESIAAYYPPYYYSFIQEVPKLKPLPLMKRLVKDSRMKKMYKASENDLLKWLRPLGILPSNKILDIGCGTGRYICELFNFGFQNVHGADKFISGEIDYGYGVKVFQRDLSELQKENYDLLMMHHVFEHMAEPLDELKKSHALLKKNGHLIVRIPVVGKAWQKYNENWIQLDAPRHFFIHTGESIAILAKQAGFTITNVVHDSNAFQFWGSELYKRNIALVDQETKQYRSPSDFFSEKVLAEYEDEAQRLNESKQGDQAVFYLKKI
ncbi:class I SAM-dependent methyltransferase [Pedobacter hartonius]|uniref:Methyltransferase domain-containing protein n=1 Tax=Pedobacter hartonius TaxID=425514 RepID=A0A1H4GYT9_9SPHI|nr:class I SAM-dependent methyltransferase [Pedobacter hartonius]SEB14250.1 Methyltransferase domain-containing protein [Pedobacter hartonius]